MLGLIDRLFMVIFYIEKMLLQFIDFYPLVFQAGGVLMLTFKVILTQNSRKCGLSVQ